MTTPNTCRCGRPYRQLVVNVQGGRVAYHGCARCMKRQNTLDAVEELIRTAAEILDEEETPHQGRPISPTMAEAVLLLQRFGGRLAAVHGGPVYSHAEQDDEGEGLVMGIENATHVSTLLGMARRGLVRRDPKSSRPWKVRPFIWCEGQPTLELVQIARLMVGGSL